MNRLIAACCRPNSPKYPSDAKIRTNKMALIVRKNPPPINAIPK